MTWIFLILFWIALAGLFHSYLLYPWLLKQWSKGKAGNQQLFAEADEWPQVSIISSLYNEETVIGQKLDTLQAAEYPEHKLAAYIGSDCSSDGTNAIVQEKAADWNWLHFYPFEERRGKPPVINQLVQQAISDHGEGPRHVLLITDANVMLTRNTLVNLVRHFKNPDLAIVDAHMRHTGMREDSISRAENEYISREVWLKHREGLLWQRMMGPFGGCYAIRSDYYQPVPLNYLVDDFYIAMSAFERGGGAINDLEATVYEAVSHDLREEYRRKRRISAGNFQNMYTFRRLWWPPTTRVGFAFFSHKILRWLGPFLLLLLILCPLVLVMSGNQFFTWVLGCILGCLFGLPLSDVLLRRIGRNSLHLRGVRYFLLMNVALLEGFINYTKGITTNVWQPPKRNH